MDKATAIAISILIFVSFAQVGKASEKVARDKAREAKKAKAMSLPRSHHTPNMILSMLN